MSQDAMRFVASFGKLSTCTCLYASCGENTIETGDHAIVFTLPENIDKVVETFNAPQEG